MVQFAETDLAGVLHFANYYRMMEEVEHAFWRSRGSSVITCSNDATISWPRVVTSCEYIAPVHFEDVLELRLTVARLGERSVAYDIEFARDGNRVALGKTKAVCCTMERGAFRSIPIPRNLRRALEELVPPTG